MPVRKGQTRSKSYKNDWSDKKQVNLMYTFKAKESVLSEREIKRMVGNETFNYMRGAHKDSKGKFIKDKDNHIIVKEKNPKIVFSHKSENGERFFKLTKEAKDDFRQRYDKTIQFGASGGIEHQKGMSQVVDMIPKEVIAQNRFLSEEENKANMDVLLRQKASLENLRTLREETHQNLLKEHRDYLENIRAAGDKAERDRLTQEHLKSIKELEMQYKLENQVKSISYERLAIESLQKELEQVKDGRVEGLIDYSNELIRDFPKLEPTMKQVNLYLEQLREKTEQTQGYNHQESLSNIRAILEGEKNAFKEFYDKSLVKQVSSPDLTFEMTKKELITFKENMEQERDRVLAEVSHYKEREKYEKMFNKGIEKLEHKISHATGIVKIGVEVVTNNYTKADIISHENFETVTGQTVIMFPTMK